MPVRRAPTDTPEPVQINVQITGLDHIYIAVSDFERSVAFYDGVMQAFGFRKGDRPIAGAPHAHYFNPHIQYTIRPAAGDARHDPYAPGVHHICFQVATRPEVDAAFERLGALGVDATAPALYPEYNDDYYATFFEDPDGVRLEVLARSRYRDEIARAWDELTEFTNPLAEWRARRGE